MSVRRQALAYDKEHLLACSALSRMRLRRQVNAVRESLRLRNVAAAVIAAPATRRVAFGLVVSWIGLRRTARMIRVAATLIGYGRLASSFIFRSGRATADRSRA
jgi:hypothetical protein